MSTTKYFRQGDVEDLEIENFRYNNSKSAIGLNQNQGDKLFLITEIFSLLRNRKANSGENLRIGTLLAAGQTCVNILKECLPELEDLNEQALIKILVKSERQIELVKIWRLLYEDLNKTKLSYLEFSEKIKITKLLH